MGLTRARLKVVIAFDVLGTAACTAGWYLAGRQGTPPWPVFVVSTFGLGLGAALEALYRFVRAHRSKGIE
jgi:hypothetical protein